jgi:hypothetical protein
MLLNTDTRQNSHARGRLKDLVLYVSISLVIGISIVVAAWSGVSSEGFAKWGGLLFFTAVLFWVLITNSRQFYTQGRFWLLTGVCLALHLVAFAVILSHAAEWRLLWFWIMIFEAPIYLLVRSWISRR